MNAPQATEFASDTQPDAWPHNPLASGQQFRITLGQERAHGDIAWGGSWWLLEPWGLEQCPQLVRLHHLLVKSGVQSSLSDSERWGRYPADVRSALGSLELWRFLLAAAPSPAIDPFNTAPHFAAAAHLCTIASSSLGVDVGVNLLGLLPVLIAGSDELQCWVADRVRAGAYCSLLLSELDHGSDLLATGTVAQAGKLGPDGAFLPTTAPEIPTHYRINGRKDLINGGSTHEVLVVFTRTGAESRKSSAGRLIDQAAFSVFVIDRRTPGVEAGKRWETLPVAAADISTIFLNDVVVPTSHLVGPEGGGWSVVQRTLAIIRGTIPVFSSGISTRALWLASHHAANRQLYGRPIIEFGVILRHLLTMAVIDLAISAMSLKALAMINRFGVGAVYYGAVAKHACSRLAERAVDEGRLIHGARALLRDHPYSRLVNDVLLAGTFDGTTHVVLEGLQARLAANVGASSPSALRQTISAAYRTSPKALSDVVRQRGMPPSGRPAEYAVELEPVATWCDLDPLVRVSEALSDFVAASVRSGRWRDDQALRLAAAEALTAAETMLAVVDLADPGARAAHGLRPVAASDPDAFRALVEAAYGWCGMRLVEQVHVLRLWAGLPSEALQGPLASFSGAFHRGARFLEQHPSALLGLLSFSPGLPTERNAPAGAACPGGDVAAICPYGRS